MKRLNALALGLTLTLWATGCCCSHYGQCVDWNDGCHNECDDGCRHKHCKKWWKKKHCRDKCCNVDCCDPCGGTGGDMTYGANYGVPTTGPLPAGYDPAAVMGTNGCSGCAGGTLPGVMTVPGGGGVSTYEGTPIDSSTGWTIQPVPTTGSSEPIPAPPAPTGGTPNSAFTPVPSRSPPPPPATSTFLPAPTPFLPVSGTR